MEQQKQFTRQGKRKPQPEPMIYGQVPPHSKELEMAVLGAVMLERDAFSRVEGIVKPESFYYEPHQVVFKTFESLRQRSMPTDFLTVAEELIRSNKLEDIGGAGYLTELNKNVTSTASLETHAVIIQQKFVAREVIRVSSEAIGAAFEGSKDVKSILQNLEQNISYLSLAGGKTAYKPLQKVVDRLLMKIEEERIRPDKITGVPTGIGKLNFATWGWQPTDLIILAARPSIGKSAVAGNLAIGAALNQEKPTPVGIFTLEMSDLQWAQRIVAAESQIDAWKISRSKISDQEMNVLNSAAYTKLSKAKIFIDDTPGIDIYEFKSKARRMVFREGVGLIIVDYLQLMSGTGDERNREQEIATISRNLKGLAKELNIPIIALSQLSRGVDRNNSKPKLSDLRESGAIEQDADTVIFLIPVDEEDVKRDPSLKDSINLKIAKHRNGALEDIEVKFVKSIQKIMSRSEYDSYLDWLQNRNLNMATARFSPIPEDELPF